MAWWRLMTEPDGKQYPARLGYYPKRCFWTYIFPIASELGLREILQLSDTTLVYLNWKLRLRPGHFGLCMLVTQQAKKWTALLPEMVNPNYWGEIELLRQVSMPGTQVVNSFSPIKIGFAGLARTQIVRVKNTGQLLLSKLRLSKDEGSK